MRRSAVAPAVEDRRAAGPSSASGWCEQQLEPALRRAGEERRRLVAAEVEHAHGRDAAGERLSSGASAARCSASLGQLRRVEEGELGAQQADALGARLEAGVELGARRGVGEDAHAVAVAGDGGELAVAARLRARSAASRALRGRRALDARPARARARRGRPRRRRRAARPRARSVPRRRGPTPSAARAPRATIAAWAVGPPAARAIATTSRASSATSAGPSSSATSTVRTRAPARHRRRRCGRADRVRPGAGPCGLREPDPRRPSERTSSARAASVGVAERRDRVGVARAGGLERRRRGVAREHLALEVGAEARILRHQDAGARRSRPRRGARRRRAVPPAPRAPRRLRRAPRAPGPARPAAAPPRSARAIRRGRG